MRERERETKHTDPRTSSLLHGIESCKREGEKERERERMSETEKD